MSLSIRLLGLVLTGLLVTACSSTHISNSWSDKSYKGQIKNVYIVGISKNELNRMIFENNFERSLTSDGVKAIASYKDLLSSKEPEKEAIIRRMRANNCDSVLFTRVISQRKETISSGDGSYRYSQASLSPGLYVQSRQYSDWSHYYAYGRVNYVEPSSIDIAILTIESVLYDLKTEELIWSAQLETSHAGDIEKTIRLFVDEVTKDLRGKDLI